MLGSELQRGNKKSILSGASDLVTISVIEVLPKVYQK
jgi:hypothetical protein